MIPVVGRRRVLWISVTLLLLFAGSCAILTLSLTTRQGVNYRVTAHRIPAYVKTIDFLQRHYQYHLLVSRICAGRPSDVECLLAIFDWTHKNVPPTPDGWTVVDDHVTNIIIRGHGTSDQIADVFATLSVYAGVPAFFKWVKAPGHDTVLVLAFARIDSRWIPFDVEHQIAFKDRQGNLAGVDELVADPALVDAQAAGRLVRGLPYSTFISRQTLVPFVPPSTLRADLQQPWPRLRYELRRAIGWERE